MSDLEIYRRKGSKIYSYRGTIAGRRIRGTTRTTDKERAKRIAAEREVEEWKCDLDGPSEILTFAKAAMLYRSAGKETKYLTKIEDYFKDTLVKKIKGGTIKQMAIDIYPHAGGATRNRQAITPAQAIINHCADLELCAPIRVSRFDFEKKIKPPFTVEWLDTFCAHARPLTAALATFMFATACRISEAKRLDWPDIDFQQRTILVVKTKNKQQRLPHMPQRLLVALANLPRDDKPFGRWSESSLRRFWDQDIAKTAKAVPGFRRLTFHSGRHGFITKLLRARIDVKTVASLANISVQVLLETYAHEINDATLTEGIFDTPSTQAKIKSGGNNDL